MPGWTRIEQEQASAATSRRIPWDGVSLGVVYGLFLRLVVENNALNRLLHSRVFENASEVMTLGFLVLGPFVIGVLTISRADVRKTTSILEWIFAPWLSVVIMMLLTALLSWEGAICIAMATPIALAIASVGGVCAGLAARRKRVSAARLSCVAILPFIVAPLEVLLAAPTQTRTVSNSIRIHAPAPVVWRNIARVQAISPSELRPTWTHRIGFPRPVEATLSREGVGGIRHASFERGVLFLETVTVWKPNERLAFTIRADSAHIPSTTLDEHVTIGGRYFDVLDGEYRIEPLPNGDTLLYLTSHQRLTTNFNGYAGLWTDAVMQSLQTSILQVIRHRCEASS